MSCGGQSIFGNQSQFIKFQGNDIVAIEGVNTVERLLGGDIRIPYKQLLKGRVILKPGQINYLLNHLGMGDNATFVAIKATYNTASVNEEDNYVVWNYYDNFSNSYVMNQIMILTGNSTNRIKQLYLTNPNTKYSVVLDVMIASIDDTYTFFPDTVNQTATTFVSLDYYDVISYVVGESIEVKDQSDRPLIYIQIPNINFISRMGNVITIDDNNIGQILLVFGTQSDAAQVQSELNYVLNNQNVTLPMPLDTEPPVIYWNSQVGGVGDYIAFNGATSGVPYSTSDGFTFSTSISLGDFGPTISVDDLIVLLIGSVSDSRDGDITIDSSNISLYGTMSLTQIVATGSYSMTFSITDLALNSIGSVNMNLTIIE